MYNNLEALGHPYTGQEISDKSDYGNAGYISDKGDVSDLTN